MSKKRLKYSPLASRPSGRKYPILSTRIESNNTRSDIPFQTIIDTGADSCIFAADLGLDIDIDIRSVKPIFSAGHGTKKIPTYYHSVLLIMDLDGYELKHRALVGFVYEGQVAKLGIGLLGRNGFLDRIESIKFMEKKEQFEIEFERKKHLPNP